mmetsp:Transcript_7591/g.18583  ORF Transcript_7591/g.18583 Transcript_7591/m.18583 type:complete len:201 (-) Transcript_7591:417-1019(-)
MGISSRAGDFFVKVFHVKAVLGVGIEKDPVKLEVPRSSQCRQDVLPPSKENPYVGLGVPAVLAELGIDVRVGLNNGMLGGLPFLLQNGIDNAHSETNVQDPAWTMGRILRRADILQKNLGVGFHDWPFPFHHDRVLVGIQEGISVGGIFQLLQEIINLGRGLLFDGQLFHSLFLAIRQIPRQTKRGHLRIALGFLDLSQN